MQWIFHLTIKEEGNPLETIVENCIEFYHIKSDDFLRVFLNSRKVWNIYTYAWFQFWDIKISNQGKYFDKNWMEKC